MSYKYTNVREYQGGLIYGDDKNKTVTDGAHIAQIADGKYRSVIYPSQIILNSDYGRFNPGYLDFSMPTVRIRAREDGIGQVLMYDFNHRKSASYTTNAMSILKLDGMLGINGFVSDTADTVYLGVEKNSGKIFTRIVIDGLYMTDANNNTCYLKFEDGKLKINGKEIATIENS